MRKNIFGEPRPGKGEIGEALEMCGADMNNIMATIAFDDAGLGEDGFYATITWDDGEEEGMVETLGFDSRDELIKELEDAGIDRNGIDYEP